MTDARDSVTIVTGYQRCGASLAMQMLAAGGYPCTGPWPDYELLPNNEGLVGIPPGARAIKILFPRKLSPAIEGPFRVLWVERDIAHQVASFAKSIDASAPHARARVRGFEARLRNEAFNIARTMEKQAEGRFGRIAFEYLINQPDRAAWQLARFVERPLRLADMAAQVRARPTGCYAGTLKLDQRTASGHD